MLHTIQSELKAPKGNYNSFGKYKYRSCEDIVEALKPLLAKHECHLILSDDVVMVGERIYVKATASIYQGAVLVGMSTAFAREPETKKGADESQITGTASSYARKYALNGLLAIDDTKDADTDEDTAARNAPSKQPAKIDESVKRALHECVDIDGLRSVWKTLTTEQREAHMDILNEVKERLS